MVTQRLTLLCAGMLFLPSVGHAASYAGRIVSVRGQVSCQLPKTSANKRVEVTKGYQVLPGSTLRTGDNASARLVMKDKSILALGPNTEMRIAAYGRSKRSSPFAARLRLGSGKIWARVSKWFGRDKRRFEVETSNAVAGVRGTEFVVHIDEGGNTNVWVVEGEVEMGSPGDTPGAGGESQMVGGNQRGSVGNSGEVQVDDVTAEQVNEQVGSVGGGASDDDEDASNRRQQAGAEDDGDAADDDTGEEDGGEDKDEGEEGNGDEEAEADVPPIDLDPGSGNARVRGRIEVRD